MTFTGWVFIFLKNQSLYLKTKCFVDHITSGSQLSLMSKPAEEQEQERRKKEEEQKTQSHRILPYSNIDLLAAGSPTSTLLPPCCHRPTKHLCTLPFHKILGTHFLASSFTSLEIQMYVYIQINPYTAERRYVFGCPSPMTKSHLED